MKNLIKQIEDYKMSEDIITHKDWTNGYNDAIKDILNLLKSYSVIKDKKCDQCWVIDGICQNCGKDYRKNIIKTKALRKQGTNKWYEYYIHKYNGNIAYITNDFPSLYPSDYDFSDDYIPSDAELVNLTIIVEPN